MRRFGERMETPRARAARRIYATLGAAALLLLGAARASAAAPPALGPNPFNAAPVALRTVGDMLPPAAFTDQTGATRSLDEFRGKTLVVGFIYTSCKDECPLITRKFASLEPSLPDAKFHLVEISIDPARDTPRVLAAYARQYRVDPRRRTLLTASPAALEHFERALGVSVIDDGRGAIIHNDRTIVVDANGRIADIIDEAAWSPADVAADAQAAAGLTANPLDRLDLALGRAVAYVCGGVINGRAGLTDLVAVVAIFGLSAWGMLWVSRRLFSSGA